jgi:hypothetical protein
MTLGLSFSAGQRLTAAQLQAIVDQVDELTAPGWAAYTPTWTCSGSAPSLGSGTLTGSYRRTTGGDLIIANGFMSAAADTTFGTGTFQFAVPVTAAAGAVNVGVIGSAQVLDAGTFRRPAQAVLAATTFITLISLASPGDVGQGTPQTFTTGDSISWTIAYQPA